jgi:hypothetical protein
MTLPHGESDVEESADVDQHWHLSRSIPLAFILSMLVYVFTQIGIFGWFASSMNSRVETVEHAQAQAATQGERSQTQMSTQGERLTRVEEKLVAVQSGIADIKVILQSPGKPAR